jgi:hypothetical protein
MKNRLPVFACVVGILVVFFASCSRNPGSAQSPVVPAVSYVLTILSVDTVHVVAGFSHENNASFTLLFPPFTADNPAITFLGNNIHAIKLTDATITDSLHTGLWFGDTVQSMTVSSPDNAFTIEYDITFPYAPNGSPGYRTILPGRYSASRGYYQGNYLFCVPASGATTASWWRGNLDAAVEINYQAPQPSALYGVPHTAFSCNNAYELFFVQFGITDQFWSCGSATSGIISLSATTPGPDALALICSDLEKADQLCRPFYPSPGSFRTVMVQDSGSGLEGLFSFYMMNWSYADLAASLRPVITHEALHEWIGIRTGDLDDPWWKEGTASYLGRVLAANVGFPKDSLRPQLVKSLSGDLMTNSKALSDPYVRDHLYDKNADANCLVLVYDKGAQACMVLDKMIRQATGNGATLFSKTGALCTRYDHSAFSRSQFKALLEENTSLDLSGFFATCIDSPGALDTAELSNTWSFLDSCGAFEARP